LLKDCNKLTITLLLKKTMHFKN